LLYLYLILPMYKFVALVGNNIIGLIYRGGKDPYLIQINNFIFNEVF
jgi:hypothetical protein